MIKHSHNLHRLLAGVVLLASTSLTFPAPAKAQQPISAEPGARQKLVTPEGSELSQAPSTVDVKPVARDEEIRERLLSVLGATGWFTQLNIQVDKGVVFLGGVTQTNELKTWAGDLARRTQDVVAVANRIAVPEPGVWDLAPARAGLKFLWRDSVQSLPFFALGLVILMLSLFAGILVTRGARHLLRRQVEARLLRNVLSGAAGVLVFLLGTYVVLRVSGLTQLALTIVGGTGLIGLAVGIAFRDITENFLASIFLSMQRPFETGDLIEVAGVTGFVQQLNVRTTILMSLDGNLVQIPNATVYKSNLRNFTSNTNRREDFVVGIGYEVSIQHAQEVARKVLTDHPAVLTDPEPSVLADNLGAATVNLRVYFWLNGREHSWLKVRSSVIRLVKRAFQDAGISMPDEAREIVFPNGVAVTLLKEGPRQPHEDLAREPPPREAGNEVDTISTQAEAGLYSEAVVIEEQARHTQPLMGENLLPVASAGAQSSKLDAKPS